MLPEALHQWWYCQEDHPCDSIAGQLQDSCRNTQASKMPSGVSAVHRCCCICAQPSSAIRNPRCCCCRQVPSSLIAHAKHFFYVLLSQQSYGKTTCANAAYAYASSSHCLTSLTHVSSAEVRSTILVARCLIIATCGQPSTTSIGTCPSSGGVYGAKYVLPPAVSRLG